MASKAIKFVTKTHLFWCWHCWGKYLVFFWQYILTLLSSLRTYAPPDYRTEGTLHLLSDSESDEAAVPPDVPAVVRPPQQAPVVDGPHTIRHGEYTVVVGGSQRGKDILVDGQGFTYNVQKKTGRYNMVAVYISTKKWPVPRQSYSISVTRQLVPFRSRK